VSVCTILCIDIGTSSIKAGLVDSRGHLSWWHREPLLITPSEQFTDWAADRWLSALANIPWDTGVIPDAAVVSGNGPTLVPVGGDGEPVSSALHWIDTREERIQGQKSFFLPKARWFMNNHPGAFEATRSFLTCPDFVACCLTGARASAIPSNEFAAYQWDAGSISAYGMNQDLFPEHVLTGTALGPVTRAAGERFGIPEGTPVYAGGADFLMSILGTAAVRPGITCDRAGTSEGINYCSSVPVDSRRLRTLPHAIEGLYNIAGILSSTGRIFEWYRRIAGLEDVDYDEMLAEVAAVGHAASRPLFIPSLHVGETWEFTGAAFMQLEPEYGAGELGRAVVESIGFTVRDLIETLDRNSCRIGELRVSGGQGRSAVWNQMKADITGKPVKVPVIIDAELAGNAAAALYGMGRCDSIAGAAEQVVNWDRVYEPDMAEHRRYSQSFGEFMEACSKVVGILSAI
jgi:xylulokinase